MSMSAGAPMFPLRALTQAVRNLDRRIRKVENREISLEAPITIPALLNSWVAVGGYSLPSYWKDNNGTVNLAGRVSGGAVPSIMFVLPVGYRPRATQSFGTSLGDVIEIDVAGVVTVVTGASPVSLDGLTFRAFH